ncbi:hypothetical protein HanRHA438_Chr12g0570891 [Helianthus annuus]|nr:hypothetical protein HanRHA438_Chr12g0570891 [Helianthus annuus]
MSNAAASHLRKMTVVPGFRSPTLAPKCWLGFWLLFQALSAAAETDGDGS